MRLLPRVRRGKSISHAPAVRPRGSGYRNILVALRLDDVGADSIATALAVAKESGADVTVLAVVGVPRRFPLEGAFPTEIAAKVDASLEQARALGEAGATEVATDVVRARSVGHAIVDQARSRGADLVVLGSSSRWQKKSRVFSPTADFVERNAHCEVLVVPVREDFVDE